MPTDENCGAEKPANGVAKNVAVEMSVSDNGEVVKSSPENGAARTSKYVACLRQNVLTILTLGAVLAGIVLGFILREAGPWTKRQIMYVNFPGELFLRMLKCLILPLIVSSLVSALGGLDVRLSGKIGVRAVVYYLGTTILAIILGIILVIAIRPGMGADSNISTEKTKNKPTLTADTLMDLVRNMFPPNIMEACISQYSTYLIEPEYRKNISNVIDSANWTTPSDVNDTALQGNWTLDANATENNASLKTAVNKHEWEFKGEMGGGTNIIGLVVFSVVLGITLGRMGAPGKPLLDLFTSLSEAMMLITRLVIYLSPVGVLFLVASKVMEVEDLSALVGQLGLYTLTVIIGLVIHGAIVLPLMYTIILKRLPFRFMYNMLQAIATAFGTSSSSATLPVTITCLEEKNGIDPRVSRFCLPVGATINMDGTALYEAVAAIFISQVRKIPLSIGKIIAISITATAASIGAAGIPQAGLVTMVMVLNVVGLPADDVAIIFVVDWLLDRFRTAVNVLGDSIGAGIVAHLSRNDLTSAHDSSFEDKANNKVEEVTSM